MQCSDYAQPSDVAPAHYLLLSPVPNRSAPDGTATGSWSSEPMTRLMPAHRMPRQAADCGRCRTLNSVRSEDRNSHAPVHYSRQSRIGAHCVLVRDPPADRSACPRPSQCHLARHVEGPVLCRGPNGIDRTCTAALARALVLDPSDDAVTHVSDRLCRVGWQMLVILERQK